MRDIFYNPPLVLVLEDVGEISDDLWVAQTYHDIYLAGPGDLILSAEQTGTDELFVECWNTYRLNTKDLDPPLGQISLDIMEAIEILREDSDAYPVWAFQTKPLTNHDVRIYFRELEAEVARIFSL